MTEYAFPKDLFPGVKANWNAPPVGQGIELPDDSETRCEMLASETHRRGYGNSPGEG